MTLWAYDKDVWGNAADGAYWRRESFNAELSGHLVYYLEDLNEVEVIMRRHSNGEIGNIKLEVKADEDDPWQPVNFDVLSDQHTQGGWRDFQIKADLSEMEGPLNYFRITISEPNAAWHPVLNEWFCVLRPRQCWTVVCPHQYHGRRLCLMRRKTLALVWVLALGVSFCSGCLMVEVPPVTEWSWWTTAKLQTM